MRGWFKSTKSNAGDGCLEVNYDGPMILVRDTKNREGGTLTFAREAWRELVADAAAGQIDRPGR